MPATLVPLSSAGAAVGPGNDDEPVEKEALLMTEGDLLRGLLEAASDLTSTTEVVPIKRSIAGVEKVLFQFSIRALTEREYDDCREKATTYRRERKFANLKVAEDTDGPRLRSHIIYTATVEKDRAALWDNKKLWSNLGVLNAVDAIDGVLRAGEKDKIVTRIEELSGFGGDLEETAGN